MTSRQDTIQSIVEQAAGSTPIPRERVESWMQSEDMEVLGALWAAILSETSAAKSIEPPLSSEDGERFAFHYFSRCLKEDPVGEWADSRYSAAHEISSWFQARSAAVDDPFLARAKEFLGRVYLDGDAETRNAIVTGALEHILEDRRWRRFFRDWREHPVLREAYTAAVEWSG